jgi:hypothetical protein
VHTAQQSPGVTSGADLLNTGGPHCPFAFLSPSAREGIKDRDCSEAFIFLLRNADWSAEFLYVGPILLVANRAGGAKTRPLVLQKLRNPDKLKIGLESRVGETEGTSGAEARFLFFLVLSGTSGTRALPGLSWAGFVERASKSKI